MVWVRKEGLIEKRSTGKPGQAFVAGCQLPKETPAKAKPAPRLRGAAKHARAHSDLPTRLIRGLFIAAGLGAIGLLAYVIISLVHLIR